MSALDTGYFREKLTFIVRDLSHYTPQEMARELVRLAKVADESETIKDAATQPTDGGHREAFEVTVCELVPRPLFLRHESTGEYQEIMVQGFWSLWQAALAQRVVSEAPTDAQIEQAALKHVAPLFGKIGKGGDYKLTEQFCRLKAFALELFGTTPPAAPVAWDADATTRLRSIVTLLGLTDSVPDGDLTGHEFAALGFVRRAIEQLKAAQQDTARLDFVCAEKCLIFHYPCLDGITRYALEWPYDDTEQPGMHETPRAAIDAASTAPDTYRKRMYR